MYHVFRNLEDENEKAAITYQWILPQLGEAVECLKREALGSPMIKEALTKLGVCELTIHKLKPELIIQLYAGYLHQAACRLKEQNEKLLQDCSTLQKEKERVERENERLRKKRKESQEELETLKPKHKKAAVLDDELTQLGTRVQEHVRGVFKYYKCDTEKFQDVLARVHGVIDQAFHGNAQAKANDLRKIINEIVGKTLSEYRFGDQFIENTRSGINDLFRDYIMRNSSSSKK